MIPRKQRLENNFSLDYVKAMNPHEITLILNGGEDIPESWLDLPNVQEAIEIYKQDPNKSFFQRKYKELGLNPKDL